MIYLMFFAAALSVPAIEAANADDARCIAWFLDMGNRMEKSGEQAWDIALSKSGALLFAGRITGRDPAIDLKGAIVRAGAALNTMSAADRARCRDALYPISVALHDGGDDLWER